MKIEILMATMNKESINDINCNNKKILTDILIINQANKEAEENVENKRMLTFNERGSSKSRNRALQNATGEICIIADDDVSYVDNYQEIILNAFNNNEDADIITFQVMSEDGCPMKDNYMREESRHNFLTIMKCCSIEIAFRREKVTSVGLSFDEEFGLGSKYRIHDDNIFLHDALKSGLKIQYIPIPIVIHPKESSGTAYDAELIFSKGAAFVRMYGRKGFLLCIIFAARKYKIYRKDMTFLKFILTSIKGANEYLKNH